MPRRGMTPEEQRGLDAIYQVAIIIRTIFFLVGGWGAVIVIYNIWLWWKGIV